MSALRDLRRVLIVGGGVGGMATAIMLARHGVVADLIDVDPQWRVYGAGISISGPTFRAFARVGVLDDIMREGNVSHGLRLCQADGTVFADLPVEPGQGGGILRPVLHRILAERVKAAGTRVRLGISVDAIAQDDAGADVRFRDGARERYDFVVAADGINSGVRKLIFPAAPAPQYTGQGCWRVLAERPPEIDRSYMYFAGIKSGITPISREQLYLYTLQELPGNPHLDPVEFPAMLRTHLAPFGGYIGAIRDGLNADSSIVYRPLEKLLLDSPWYAGRVLLIGDAAHSTTPHLASGAGLAVEDACVLTEELVRATTLTAALAAFMARRFERCRIVVENSVRLGELEMAGAPDRDQAALLGQSMAVLAGPM